MKELCNSIMKLSPNSPYGIDYTPIVLALFFRENKFNCSLKYSLYDFSNYVFCFYCDIKIARENHYSKMINNIFHYQPQDLFNYCKKVLEYVSQKTNLIILTNENFKLNFDISDLNLDLLNNIVKILVAKYINSDVSDYYQQIITKDISTPYNSSTKIFNRALRFTNRCFICDETDLNKLEAVELMESEIFKDNNYLILCNTHAKLFRSKNLIIKKNGYPYINGQRLFQHLEIEVLKVIRENLHEL